MKIKTLIYIFLWICFPVKTEAQKNDTIKVSNFGILPDSRSDATQAVQRAIETCKHHPGSILWFDKGQYNFTWSKAVRKVLYESNTSSEDELADKTKTIGLYFENIHGLQIEGNGSTFIFHGKMTPWSFIDCDKIQMKDITIDFAIPTMAEITFLNTTDSIITATIHPNSKFRITGDKLIWYGENWTMNNFHAVLTNPKTGINTYSTWEPFQNSQTTLIHDRTIRFKGSFAEYHFKPGDILTVRDPVRDQTGGFISHSSNIKLANINIRYMHGLGILSQLSRNLYFEHVNIKPGPGGKRAMSSFADAMHFSSCGGEIKIENCQFKGLHDDPINVHGTHLQIGELISDKKLRIKFMHPQTYGFKVFFAGDSVAFVRSETLEIFDKGRIKNAELISPYEMIVELENPAPNELVIGDCLENLSWSPSLTVKNCRFESVNTRGLLVTTRGKVLIENNVFYRTGMHAILIADDALSWFESGPVEDVTIKNNHFIECGYNSAPDNFTIAIAPENHKLVPNYYVHRNIRIENNVFLVYAPPLLTARSTKGLTFKNNSIYQTHLMSPGNNKTSFRLTACSQVNISNNRFHTEWKTIIDSATTDKPEKN